jgi:hypothetical protein
MWCKMTKWQEVKEFFNNLEPGEFAIRAQYMNAFDKGMKSNILDLYRCYLQRAGYLYDKEYYFRNRGVYFMVKKIPKNLTLTQVVKQAYPNRLKKIYRPTFAVIHEVSPQLAEIIGLKIGTRSEIFKKVWQYVRKYEHHDSVNRRWIFIKNDDKFLALMEGRNKLTIFEMATILGKHILREE